MDLGLDIAHPKPQVGELTCKTRHGSLSTAEAPVQLDIGLLRMFSEIVRLGQHA